MGVVLDVAVRPLRGLSLCTGGYGLDLGVRAAVPYRTIVGVEWEASAAALLVARMADGSIPEFPIWSDLKSFDATSWRGCVDIVIGGIPCQPHSVAGKGLGAADPRDLWPDAARVIRECEPKWFFLENVPGMLGYIFHRILPELQEMGYVAETLLVKASDVGAPHRRERLFVLAHAGLSAGSAEQRVEPEAVAAGAGQRGAGMADAERSERSQPQAGRRHGAPTTVGDAGADVGDADEPGLQGRQRPISISRDEQPIGASGSTLGLFPPGPGDYAAWQRILRERPDLAPATKPGVRSVADGVAGRMGLTRAQQLRTTGNGVVPLQAALAFTLLARRFG